jgi:hypothetical protein
MTQDQETKPLEELDAQDRARLEQVEKVVARVIEVDRPTTMSELSVRVRANLGEVENSVIRAAVLRLLNANRLRVGNHQEVPAAR